MFLEPSPLFRLNDFFIFAFQAAFRILQSAIESPAPYVKSRLRRD